MRMLYEKNSENKVFWLWEKASGPAMAKLKLNYKTGKDIVKFCTY